MNRYTSAVLISFALTGVTASQSVFAENISIATDPTSYVAGTADKDDSDGASGASPTKGMKHRSSGAGESQGASGGAASAGFDARATDPLSRYAGTSGSSGAASSSGGTSDSDAAGSIR